MSDSIRNFRRVSAAFAAVSFAAAAEWSVPPEPLEVRTLAGDTRAFPGDVPVPRTIFVVTYSKAATTTAAEWTKRLREMKPGWDVNVYQVSVLNDVPALFRGAVITGMAAGVPQDMHDRFWVAELHGRHWRTFTDSELDELPHVVVLDHRNRIVWRAHGPAAPDKVQEIARLAPPEAAKR